MAMLPIVRYMPLCENWLFDPPNTRRIVIQGLLTNLRSLETPPYPLLYRELCVFLALTEIHHDGEGRIVAVHEEDGEEVINLGPRPIPKASDPLAVVAVPFRARNVLFSRAGVYAVQFWFAGELVEQRPLRVR